MKLGINKKVLLILFFIIWMFLNFTFSETINWLKYSDEIITFFSLICISSWFVVSKRNGLINEFRKLIIYLLIICIIGFLGNYIYKICPSFFSELIDCLGILKPFASFIFIYVFLNKIQARKILKFLNPLAKIYLITGTIFGIVSLFIDLGMGAQLRFGIKTFCYVFYHAHVQAIMAMSSLLVISVNEKNKYKIYWYTILTCLLEILTTKGPSLIWVAMIFLMFRYYAHNKKIKPWLMVVIIILGIALGGYQINSYLTNPNAPRYLFNKYGIITANTYFPFGSGFATFGGERARWPYSKLYYEYGFNVLNGLTPTDGRFLNDNYWPMAIGQFGYIGALLLLYSFYKVFLFIQRNCENRIVKAIIITNFAYIIIHSLGSAALTGAEGVWLFLIFGIVTATFKQEESNKDKING